jgi:hypothetical protein
MRPGQSTTIAYRGQNRLRTGRNRSRDHNLGPARKFLLPGNLDGRRQLARETIGAAARCATGQRLDMAGVRQWEPGPRRGGWYYGVDEAVAGAARATLFLSASFRVVRENRGPAAQHGCVPAIALLHRLTSPRESSDAMQA